MLLFVLSDACSFPSTNQLLTPQEYHACLNSIPLDQELFSREQGILEHHSQLYVHEEHFANTSLDLLQQLKSLRNRFENNTAATFHQYQTAIQEMVQQYQDEHFMYYKPSLYAYFNQYMPLQLHRNGKEYYFQPNALLLTFNNKYKKQVGDVSQYVNKTIETINGMPVDDFLAEYARKYEFQFISEKAKINRVYQVDLLITQPYYSNVIDDYEFEVVLQGGEHFTMYKLIELRAAIPTDADLLNMYKKCIRENPYKQAGSNIATKVQPEAARIALPSLSQHNTDITFDSMNEDYVVVTQSPGFFALYQNKKTTDCVYQIVGFSPADYETAMRTLLDSLHYLKENMGPQSRVFISILMNGGGNPTIAQLLANALSAQNITFPRTVMKDCRIWRILSHGKTLMFQFKLFDQLENYVYTDFYGQAPVTDDILDRLMVDRQKSGNFSYSNWFNFDIADYPINKDFADFGSINLPPNRIIIVSDGTCLSAAGYFVEYFKQRNLATFVSAGRPASQICAVSGGVFMATSVYEYSVINILQTPELKALYNNTELVLMQKYYMPFDALFGVTTYSSAGFNVEQDVREVLDYVNESFDVVFEDIDIAYPGCVNSAFLDHLAPVIAYNFTEKNYGEMCKQDDGVVYRWRGNECVVFGCDSKHVKHEFAREFRCVGAETNNNEKQKNVGYIVSISIVSVILLVCIGVIVWMYLDKRHYTQKQLSAPKADLI